MTVQERFELLKEKYYYDNDAAEEKIRFIESRCRHQRGRLKGKLLKLTEWQKNDILRPIFGLKEKKGGLRLITKAYIEIPRKNAKTTLCSAIQAALLFNDGEPGAEIYNCAGDDEQASLLFGITKGMVKDDPILFANSRLYQSTIVYNKDDSFIRKITSKSETKHGQNIHGAIYDELHVAPNSLLYDVIDSATGARMEPLFISITTAGFDRETICYTQHITIKNLLAGIGEDDSYWGVLYAAPMDADIYDEETWRQANPLYDTSEELRRYFKKAIARIKNEPSYESAFRRLHLDQWVGTAETWIPDDVWMSCKAEPEFTGKCYGGVDLSTVGDISAYVLFWPETNSVKCYLFVPLDSVADRSRREGINYDVWVNDKHITATPGNTIDYSYIMKAMIESREKYDVAAIGFDRYLMEDLGNKFSQADVDLEQWPLLPIGQGYISMSEPTKTIERMAHGGEMRHGGNPVLRWMCSNIQIESDAAGNIKMSKKKSREKIDGMVALAMAISAWGGAEPEFRSRYEDEGAELDSINM